MNNNDSEKNINALDLIIVIVPRGKGEKIVTVARENGVTFSLITPARGGVGTRLIELLGLKETDKDMILLTVHSTRCKFLIKQLNEKFNFTTPASGIVISIPLSGVSGPMALRYLAGLKNN